MPQLTEEQQDHNHSRFPADMQYICAPNHEQLARDIGSNFPNGTRLIITELNTETAANAQLIAESDLHYYSIMYFKRSAAANKEFHDFQHKIEDVRTTIPIYPIPASMIERVDLVLDERVKTVVLPLNWKLKKIIPESNPIRRKTHMFATGYNVPLSVQGHGLKGTNGPYSTWTPKPTFPKPPDRLLEMTNFMIEKNIKSRASSVRISMDGRVPFIPVFVDITLRDAVKRAREFADISFRYHLQTLKYLEHYQIETTLVNEINRIFPIGPTSGLSNNKHYSNARDRTMNWRPQKAPLSTSSSSSTSPDTGDSSRSSKSSEETVVAGGTPNRPMNKKKQKLTLRQKFTRLPIFCILIVDDDWYWSAVCWRESTQMIKMTEPSLGGTWSDGGDGQEVREWVEEQIQRFYTLSMAFNVEFNQKLWDLWPKNVDVLKVVHPESASEKLFREMRVEQNFRGKDGQPTVFDMGEDYVEKKKKEKEKGKEKNLGHCYGLEEDAFSNSDGFSDDDDFNSAFLSEGEDGRENDHTPADSDDNDA